MTKASETINYIFRALENCLKKQIQNLVQNLMKLVVRSKSDGK